MWTHVRSSSAKSIACSGPITGIAVCHEFRIMTPDQNTDGDHFPNQSGSVVWLAPGGDYNALSGSDSRNHHLPEIHRENNVRAEPPPSSTSSLEVFR